MIANIFMCVALLIATALHAPMHVFMIPLWLCIATMPLIFANSIAVAMQDCLGKAGSASAIIGVLQFALASVVSSVVSFLHNGTAFPMVGVMLTVVTLGAIVNQLDGRRGRV